MNHRLEQSRNTFTPPETLMKLADDDNVAVRWGVAHNTSTPPETLMKLAADEDMYVRLNVLKNPNCPEVIKIWLNNGGYAGLSIDEFAGMVDNE
jgi:Leucine rich repeat variant